MFAEFHPEGIGIEVMYLLFGIFFCTLLYFAWLSTGFPALNYEIFLVDIQTWTSHRFLQVVRLDLDGVHEFSGDLIRRIRGSGESNSPNESAPRISNLNIVIQSPETIVEGQPIEPVPEDMFLYQIRIPTLDASGQEAEITDSELAALATLAIVNRGETDVPLFNFEEATRAEPTMENETLVGEGPLPSETNEMGESSSNQESSEISDEGEKSDDTQENIDVELEEKEEIEKPNTALKLKFLDDTHVMASTVFNRTVGDFKKEFFATALAEGKVVRLIYKGQLLRDDNRSLASYGVEDQCVVHCHVSNTPYRKASPQPTANQQTSADAHSTDESLPSVPVSTTPPPPAGNAIRNAVNSLFTQFPLRTFRAETMTAAFRGFMSDPSTPTSHPQNRGFFSNIYRRFQNALSAFENSGNEDGIEFAAQRAANPLSFRFEIGDFVLWIFAIQLAAVWTFWWIYPHLCDGTAFYLLLFFTVYFLFIVFRYHIFPESIERAQS